MMINRSSYLADAERDRPRSRGIQRTVGRQGRDGDKIMGRALSAGQRESKSRRQFLSVASEVKQHHIVLGNAVKKSSSLKSVHSYSMMINQSVTPATPHTLACNTAQTVYRRPLTARTLQPSTNIQYGQSSTMILRNYTPPSSSSQVLIDHSSHKTPRQNAGYFNHTTGQSNSFQMNSQQTTNLRQPRSTASVTSMPSTPMKLLIMG